MEQSEQKKKENFTLTINKKQLHNKKEEQTNNSNQQKQATNLQDKLDLLNTQQQNINVDSKDNLNLQKNTNQIIEAGDITKEEPTNFNHKIISHNENVDLLTSNCTDSQKSEKDSKDNLTLSKDRLQIIQAGDITSQESTDIYNKTIFHIQNIDLNTSSYIKSQKCEKDSKNNLNLSKNTCKTIEAEDFTNEEPTNFNHKTIPPTENIELIISNCIDSKKSEEEVEKAQYKNIKQIFDSQGKKMVNHYSEENKMIIYKKLYENNYFLEGYLKSGGEGDVFKGHRTNSQGEKQNIAFKIYSFEDQEDFNEEINLIKQFGEHKLIVKIYDTFEISICYKKLQTQCFILVMELCQFSLFDELNDFKERQQFSFDQLFKIIFDLLDAIIILRGHYTLHADIKSKNILKNQDNSYCFTDFGISQKKKNRDEKLIFKGGTRGYMAQEQHPNSKLIDFKSDVFSLGKVFLRVIEEFEKINQNLSVEQMNIINKFNQIIQEMLETDVQKRKTAMKIYKQFFKQINKVEFFNFLKSYYYQDLVKILYQSSNKELWKHQDYQYQLNFDRFYDKIKLSILKIISKDQFFILIQEYEIAVYQNFDFVYIEYLQKEFFDVENDWLIEMAQKLISNIIKLKNQNEYKFNQNLKSKQKLKQCYEKFKSYQSQPNHKYSQQKQQFYQNEALSKICLFLAKYYFIDKNMDEANKFFEESLQFYQKIQYEYEQYEEEEENIALFLEYEGYLLLVNNLEEAESYSAKSYHMIQSFNDDEKYLDIPFSLFHLGFINIKKGDFEKAWKYYIEYFQYEEYFENSDIYYMTHMYFLGYSIYLQIRQQKVPEIQDLNDDIAKDLQHVLNELEEKKQKIQTDNKHSIEQSLEKSINQSMLNDDQKQIVKEKILKFIEK